MTTRREFIRQTGVLLASLMMTQCTPLLDRGDSPHDRLRACWLSFDRLERRAQSDFERGQRTGEELQAQHRAALDDLVEAGDLDATVAEYVQSIYDEAIYHIWRSMATCYEPMVPPDYMPAVRGQLIQQADLLTGAAAESDLDPKVVARAQAVLERDVAFVNLPPTERDALYDKLVAAGTPYLPFDELDLEIPPPAVQAARFLVELLVED